MPQRIIDFLSKTKEIPPNEVDLLIQLVKPTTLEKGAFLYPEGKTPKHGAYVLSGILREFYTDTKGVESIRRFAYQDWWIVDLYELIHEKPALYSVQALESSELLTFDKKACDILIQKCPVTTSILLEISAAEKYSIAKKEKQKRSLSAQENYLSLLSNHPGIDKKIPLFHIASYLNIKPESLSRIRKQIGLSKIKH
ncbi:Crp/Fnr family transcriptional regulator [Wenyingzhuangia sp. 2_MG-2023]|uniref:Crp/Fnr family transcriptional regulator n=1 Tax=Wenyingzhuangia sp. 2_MG-2023 TaxID=3062639 RepID=UPI0026E138F3|nr:Crp/Fnr family transcriptional regulator [Wenyingzhuangia sp. 2_MG-2023]MDO6738122.1 Crp/Fnr family transcriptional regulator [Wenyingzhuangia sp. 2_MG-2023]MDO6801554.1 Crp/Fnr family transcriptional regulator [Wenyingzhuangia sp. 1_MG-2023]